MADIYKLITLTEKNDAGPYFDAFYSADCLTYTQSVDGNNLYLASVGSTAVITVPDTTDCIKLVSVSGPCDNYVISGSNAPTTTTTTTSTLPTTTTTTSTTVAPTTTTTTSTTVLARYWNSTYCDGSGVGPTVQDSTAGLGSGAVVKFAGGGQEFCVTLTTENFAPFIWFPIVTGDFVTCIACLPATTTTTSTSTSTTTTTTSTTVAPTTTTTTSTTAALSCNVNVGYTFSIFTICAEPETTPITMYHIGVCDICGATSIDASFVSSMSINDVVQVKYQGVYMPFQKQSAGTVAVSVGSCLVCSTTTTTTSTTLAPTTTTTTSTTAQVCNCLTVDVLNTQLTNGGLDLYYILNDCGGGSRDVNLATSIGTEIGGSTYFALCGNQTLSNLFKYGPSGSPFVGEPGMNVNGSGTVCNVDGDCSPVTPTTTTTTSTSIAPTTTTTTSTSIAPTTTTTTSTTAGPTSCNINVGYTFSIFTICDEPETTPIIMYKIGNCDICVATSIDASFVSSMAINDVVQVKYQGVYMPFQKQSVGSVAVSVGSCLVCSTTTTSTTTSTTVAPPTCTSFDSGDPTVLGNVCNTFALNTYYHDGNNAEPEVGNTVYDTAGCGLGNEIGPGYHRLSISGGYYQTDVNGIVVSVGPCV